LKLDPESGAKSRVLRVTLRCDLSEVRPKVARVRRFLIKEGCLEEQALECELALVEACTNAIEHVSPAGKRESVVIEARMEKAQVEFRVTDHTAGFEWPKTAVSPDVDSESGRGVFLIQSLITSTEYLRSKDGNVLVLRKRL